MSFWEILDTAFLKPLQILFEMIYIMTNKVIGNPGVSIVVLSLAINFLVLPLYRRADAMQEEERDMEAKLHRGVAHIKKTFRGDERMMMLQTYYRQNGYKPAYVLRSAMPLFLQIPFFIAAYRFLSGLSLLEGVAFGPIADLGKPDGMLSIADVSVNLLPIAMTVINLISCGIFTKGSTLKSKIQLYAMALFFLVFLYSSPSGLVFYWTLNNVFSLAKTIFYKLKNPRKVFGEILSIAGVGILIYALFFYGNPTLKRKLFFAGCGGLMQMPLLYSRLKNKIPQRRQAGGKLANKKVFFSGGLFLAVLAGVLIPSAVLKASPQEFVNINYFYHPLWFIASSFCLALGAFVIWLGVFYWLAGTSARTYFDRGIWIFSGLALMNYMFFGKNLGLLTPLLKYERGMQIAVKEQVWNLAAVLAVSVLLYVIYRYWERFVPEALMIAVLAFGLMSAFNMFAIHTSIQNVKVQMEADRETPHRKTRFTLSKEGKNVIVLMLDRAMGEYAPFLFNEKPELKEQFSGFTCYSNVISFGGHTNFALPAVLGGYEYTPVELNKRDQEALVSKHNEALKVMPVLFAENGYAVTVSDPSYANYQWIPDTSIYDEYPKIQSCNLKGVFTDDSSESISENWILSNKRNFFCYGILQTVPLCMRNLVYGYGDYNQGGDNTLYSEQKITGRCTAVGLFDGFTEPYNVLTHLPDITGIEDGGQNTFLLMTNDAAHDVMMLQEPEYVPALYVDNTEFEVQNQDRFTLDGRTLKMIGDDEMAHYQSNMGVMLQLGKWFDFMRENGVYDNTRIILVSDHGYELESEDALILEDGKDVAEFYPLLMVKDFGSEGFETSEEFMTNGDVPTLAVQNLIDNPVNPFTGKLIDSGEKTAHEQYIISSGAWDISINNGNTFLPAKWYSVQDSIWDKDNWKVAAEEAVQPMAE